LEYNQLKIIKENTFKGLIELILLNLNGNRIKTIESNAFYGLALNPSFQSLDLRRQNFSYITNMSFNGCAYLKTLILSSNQIKL
jgi:hypothetical protein